MDGITRLLTVCQALCAANTRVEYDHFGADDNILHHCYVCDLLLLVSQTSRHLETDNVEMQNLNSVYSEQSLYILPNQTSVLTLP
jgi:hypothetical protein